jgi:hypothetical protein
VDLTDDSSSDSEEPEEPEFAIEGVFETVLKNNMEQLQWTSLSVALLAASTALLAIAQDIPQRVLGSSEQLVTVREALPIFMAFGVDMSEQVREPCTVPAAAAWACHRHALVGKITAPLCLPWKNGCAR